MINNVRIAIRDSTDSHNVAFFDNKAGIKYKSANLQRFLAGSASILTIEYNSKDIDTIRTGCKLAFIYKQRAYWLNIMDLSKKGYKVEITAYSLGLELNQEERGAHKPANAMSFAEYLAYYDPEHALELGVNEVADKRIKLEWTGTDTILARLFSIANSFDAELEFTVELNQDYSLKRQVLNVYKKGNLGSNRAASPIRVGRGLKVINYSDNLKELRTAVRATGKDGLTIDGLNKKVYDDDGNLLYYSSGMTVYAPQSRDKYPSVGKKSNDNWIIKELGETEYSTKEALWGYMLGELKKICVPEITYDIEGAVDGDVGDTRTLIDDVHYDPPLYVQGRISELTEDLITGKVTKSTLTNFERKYSQIADILLKQVEALAEDAAPYIIRLSTNNGYIFKNGEGSSTITARLEKYSKDIAATWKWVVDNKVVGTGDKLTVKAEQVTNTMAVTVIAYVNGNEVVRDYMTFSNSDDGVGVESIDRYFTSSDQSDGVEIEGTEWSDKPPAPTEAGKYLWAYDKITYTDGTVTTTKPAAVGANFDVDAFRAEIAEELKDVPNREEFENKIAEELATSKAEIETQIETAKTQAESNAKEYADTINQETAKVAELANAAAGEIKADLVNVKNNLTSTSLVANNAQAAVDAAKQDLAAVNTKVDNAKAELTQAKQDLTTVADDLSKAKTDFQDAVSAVDTKATNLQSDLAQAKQDLTSQAQQLQAQANAQSELTKRVSSVEKTADGTKTTVSELSKTVAQNGKDITSVTARTKVVEDDLSGTKTTLSQVQTTANSTSQKTATLETGLNGLSARFENLQIGTVNLLHNSKGPFKPNANNVDNWQRFEDTYVYLENGKQYVLSGETDGNFTSIHDSSKESDNVVLWLVNPDTSFNKIMSDGKTGTTGTVFTWNSASGTYQLRVNTYRTVSTKSAWNIQIEEGNLRSTYSQNESDIESKVAEYKQTADQNYASLSSTVQTLDGQVQSNKTTAEQTAEGFKTRIESLETYKNGESERANAYFESAKTETAKQLTAERTAIANNYVAKSTYTSDVTGIRNELSATTTTANTTKTNLANYQASNDKMVASLKSSLQTTDGNVSNLQTQINAVPGQITSAVSAVEGKIPKSVNTVNLIKNTDKPFAMGGGITNTIWDDDKKWAYLDLTDPNVSTAMASEIFPQGQFYNFKPTKGMTYTQSILIDTDATFNPNGQPNNSWFTSQGHNQKRGYFEQLSETTYRFWSTCAWQLDDIALRGFDWFGLHTVLDFRNSGTYLAFYKPKLTTGNLPSDWSPSPEDYDDAITQVKSEIKQTADGITLLATKTELNNAKTELQSGINTATNKANNAQSTANSNAQTISTHTTQISALNTGLQAKVSQTDFNTLSGRVTTAENNITAKANELSSKITSVEGKIPTSVGGTNYLTNISSNWQNKYVVVSGAETGSFIQKNSTTRISPKNFIAVEAGKEYTISLKELTDIDYYFKVTMSTVAAYGVANSMLNRDEWIYSDSYTFTAPANCNYVMISVGCDAGVTPDDLNTKFNIKLERGNIPTDYSPAPEDYDSKLATTQSEIKQTADGMALLATKTEVNSAKAELQSGINTATNKANNAQSTANSNAQTISTHTTQISALNTGLSAKVSQSDFNTLSGRVTTAENNIIAKANELSSKITSVDGKIPSGEMNLVEYGRPADGYSPYEKAEYATHSFYYNKAYKMYIIKNTATSEKTLNMNRFKVERNTDYTLYFKGFNNSAITNMDVWFLKRVSGSTKDFDSAQILVSARKLSTGTAEDVSVTFNTGNYDEGWIRFDNNGSTTAGTQADLYFGDVSVKKGKSNNGWSPSLAELASSQDLKTAQSEIKQTTDAIKASVQSLDNNTVKSSSLTINADGIVMKAGKSTTDVANAIGSYFSVNQNAINLFSDKINVKGNMIVSGAITSDKIASKSINTSHLNGKIITADVISSNAVTAGTIKAGAVTTDKMSANSINGDRIAAGTLDAAKIKAGSITASQIASGTITSAQIKAGTIRAENIATGAITGDNIKANSVDVSKISGLDATYLKAKIETAMVDWLKGKTIVADNGATKIDLLSGYINFDSDTPAIRRVTPGIPTQFIKFLKSDINSVTTIGSNRDGSESSMNDSFAGIKITSGDLIEQTEIISDQIYFFTGAANRQGWQMSTVSGGDHRQVTLIPSGNPTKSNIYASDYFIRGSNGWVNLLDFINYFNVCLGHLQNLTGRYDIFKPFKI